MINRRLTIVARAGGFRVTTEYQNTLGYWNVLGETFVTTFPMLAVTRVAHRPDFHIFIRSEVEQ